ncbi:glycoside hydrolase family 18 protein [Gonapodya prolifera JEL478]|uniref:Glycoside hydrolase family 18 protein n=1 Tax=Gonapodya prolifera (strain JEL478) TaxID=1344416 RepID=A0A139AE66_GONPJ|nr:glycoside hydrolase family 18 protein [Gonapodya prolifera JEL478]|eukprot:KXS14884.1 glycoside hydrolase family 18 protein [Gonapodya prolifera JEL478]
MQGAILGVGLSTSVSLILLVLLIIVATLVTVVIKNKQNISSSVSPTSPSSSSPNSGGGSKKTQMFASNIVLYAFLNSTATDANATTLKGQIQRLKSKRPGVKVLISIGGGAAGSWSNNLNPTAIKNFINSCGADGFNEDFEANTCWNSGSDCGTKHLSILKRLRAVMPVGKYIASSAMWLNGVATGNAQASLQSGLLDYVMVMSYDTKLVTINYEGAMKEYAKYIDSTKLFVGVEAPVEGWGSHRTTIEECKSVARLAKKLDLAGVFIWHFTKADSSPTAPEMSAAIIA